MCGRYTVTATPEQLGAYFGAAVPADYAPTYNAAPSQALPIILARDGDRACRLARWGLPTRGNPMGSINARVETVLQRPSFSDSMHNYRCLVPASGFYEWQRKNRGAKQPHYIQAREEPVAFAGIYVPEPHTLRFAILTTTPVGPVVALHDRMPVILEQKQFDEWLTAPTASKAQQIARHPLPEQLLRAHPVSPRVNKPTVNDPTLTDPFEPPPPVQGAFGFL